MAPTARFRCLRCASDCSALGAGLFTAEFFGRLVGTFEQNLHGIRMPSPGLFLRQAQPHTRGEKKSGPAPCCSTSGP